MKYFFSGLANWKAFSCFFKVKVFKALSQICIKLLKVGRLFLLAQIELMEQQFFVAKESCIKILEEMFTIVIVICSLSFALLLNQIKLFRMNSFDKPADLSDFYRAYISALPFYANPFF